MINPLFHHGVPNFLWLEGYDSFMEQKKVGDEREERDTGRECVSCWPGEPLGHLWEAGGRASSCGACQLWEFQRPIPAARRPHGPMRASRVLSLGRTGSERVGACPGSHSSSVAELGPFR